jgi:DtxR family Mn-dependent transcriptional regulator
MSKIISAAAEDYLKTIYKLRANDTVVTTQALANRLSIAAPSATAMVKKLASLKLLSHTPYYGVELTPAGEKIALEVIRHHRLIETYLAEVLGLEWDKVHEEADRWEHVLSEEVETKMAEALNHPTHDPHGAPIPTLDGHMAEDGWIPLLEIAQGTQVVVRRVSDESSQVLRHLRDIGLVPNANVAVERAMCGEGVLHLRVDGVSRIVGTGPASAVFVALRGGDATDDRDESDQGGILKKWRTNSLK